jgi:hypothetical protein
VLIDARSVLVFSVVLFWLLFFSVVLFWLLPFFLAAGIELVFVSRRAYCTRPHLRLRGIRISAGADGLGAVR